METKLLKKHNFFDFLLTVTNGSKMIPLHQKFEINQANAMRKEMKKKGKEKKNI